MGHVWKDENLEMPWTIEQQLKAYSESSRKTDRHEILYVSWCQMKRWLCKMLEYSLASFPTYSQHNATHCQDVICNIESLLGETEIRKLSPTDCFVILMSVYVHDVGMCIMAEDREKMVSEDAFYEMLQNIEDGNDLDLKNAVLALQKTEYEKKDDASTRNFYKEKLDVYNALVLLFEEYQRKKHALTSSDRLKEWVTSSNTNDGFTMTGIPTRIFYQIAECARIHGEWNFDELMKNLLDSDNGFARDKYHPRFVAVLLTIGDALDIDNNRFNMFSLQYAGKLFTNYSQVHYRKHQAIRAIQITPSKIRIQAECTYPQELRELRRDCDWLESFLQKYSYHWSEIVPENFQGRIPSLEISEISLKGKAIPKDLITCRFEISSAKAFGLLQGANLYRDHYVFIREMIQNAADATKGQYWKELCALQSGVISDWKLAEANERLPVERYPIYIDYRIVRKSDSENGEYVDVTYDDIMSVDEQSNREVEIGVLVSVQDSGVGIGAENLRHISKVGQSHAYQKKELEQMPSWIRPNGHFGIGLQSLFLVGNCFQVVTRTRQEECYKMMFYSGASGLGYIDVLPIDSQSENGETVPYGTRFSVFVGESKKESHEVNSDGWAGVNPYSKDYDKLRGLRRAIEMMLQMEAYVDRQIGEAIFPIIQREYKMHESLLKEKIDEQLIRKDRERCRHTTLIQEPNINKVMSGTKDTRVTLAQGASNWLFELERNDVGKLVDKDLAYCFDEETCNLKIWSQSVGCFFCCNADKIIYTQKTSLRAEREKNKIAIYVKGIYVTDIFCDEGELIEYIDIKNDCMQSYLQMDRSYLTSGGEKVLINEVLPQLVHLFKKVLLLINDQMHQELVVSKKNYMQALNRQLDQIGSLDMNHDKEISKEIRQEIDLKKTMFLEEIATLDAVNFIDYDNFSDLSWRRRDDNEDIEISNFKKKLQMECNSVLRACLENYKNELQSVGYICWFPSERNGKESKNEWDMLSKWMSQFESLLVQILELGKTIPENTKQRQYNMKEIQSLADQLQKYVLFFSVCRFTVENIDGLSHEEQESVNCWQYLNDWIGRVLVLGKQKFGLGNPKSETGWERQYLKKVEDIYSKTLFIRGAKERNGKIVESYSFADLMDSKRHFAIFSKRESKSDRWKHVLVELNCLENNGLEKAGISPVEKVSVLDVILGNPDINIDYAHKWQWLDEWFERIIKTIKGNFKSKDGIKQNDIEDRYGRWILKKIPTWAIGTDEDGDCRLNVLGAYPLQHIFLDSRAISFLLKKMISKWKNNNFFHFRTTTWDGLDSLNCDSGISTNIMRVDYGMMSEISAKNQMLFGVNYLIPQEVYFPYDKYKDQTDATEDSQRTSLNEMGIYNIDDLLCELQEVYEQPLGEKALKWNLVMAQSVSKKCDIAVGNLLIFGDEDQELIEQKRKEYMREQDDNLDAGKLSNQIVLGEEMPFERYCESLLIYFFSNVLLPRMSKEKEKNQTFREVKLLKNQNNVKEEVLKRFFDLNNGNGPLAVQDNEVLEEDIKNCCLQMRYLTRNAAEEYKESFLKDVLKWWECEILEKSADWNTFIEYSMKNISGISRGKLKQLYMLQVRRILCSSISGKRPVFAHDELHWDRIKKIALKAGITLEM